MLGQYLGAGSATTKLLLHLNGNSTDSSGNGNNGSDSNITYSQTNGKFGQGAGFNGNSSRINFSKNSNTYLYNNWTMSAVIKRGVTSGKDTIFQMGNAHFGVDYVAYWDGSSNNVLYTGGGLISDTTNYYNLVWEKSSTDGQKLFINNKLVATNNGTSNNSDSYSNVNLGRFDSPGNTWYQGLIDEFIMETGVWSNSYRTKNFTYSQGRFGII